MDPKHLVQLSELEDTYWWHVAKRQMVTKLVEQHFPAPNGLVEGGIGSCRNLLTFQERGYDVTGFDISEQAVEYGKAKGIENVAVHDLGQPWPVAEGSQGAVVLLDVLEHVEDPALVLSHARKILKPDGGVVFTVPAHPWLFSNWDERLGHYRRYTTEMLEEQAKAANFKVEWMTYWNAWSLPVAIMMRTVERMRKQDRVPEFPHVSPALNRMLLGFAKCERWWMNKMKVPCGLSLVGVLRK